MEYLKSTWKTVVGDQPTDNVNAQQNVAETVERLVERVESSTLLEDRRDACRAIKSLSKNFRLEVGAQTMDALVFILQNDTSDNEIVTYALEALNNVIGSEEDLTGPDVDLGIQFTEIFIKRKENVQLIIDLLAEFDFKIRWPAIKLLYGLLRNKLRECQDCVLTYPMGISRMMDLLVDPREVIRNDALLLLIFLTKSNANIQKIVAFENAFDRILDIVSSEGFSDGGVIVEDCLSILLNLLKMNNSNQNFFKEGNYIQRLLPFLDISFETSWNTQKINNLLLMLKVIRSLVSPSNPQQVSSACQKVMNQSGVLQKLSIILLSNGIPAEILTETMNCVAEVIRGNQVNQDYLNKVNAPIEPPKPIIVILLMSMINEKQPFELRCAVLYCFQSFLYKNDLGQAQIVETLLPSSEVAVNSLSTGQLLCSGFFTRDALSNWFSSIALAYTVSGNMTQKQQILRVQLAIDASSSPTSLLSFCSSALQQGGHYQRRVGLLVLLSVWLNQCSLAVANFLSISTNVPYLTSQVGLIDSDENEMLFQGLCAFLLGICVCYNDDSVPSFTKSDLCQIINNRIGREIFVDKLSSIAKSDKYSQALQRPQLLYVKPSDVVFDYEFCQLYRSQENLILKHIQLQSSNAKDSGINSLDTSLTQEDHKLLAKYKELIREQDEQLTTLKKSLQSLLAENESLKYQLHEQHSFVQQLKDQNLMLKARNSIYADSATPLANTTTTTSHVNSNMVNTNADHNHVSAEFPSVTAISTNNSQSQFNNNNVPGSYNNSFVVENHQPVVGTSLVQSNHFAQQTPQQAPVETDRNLETLANQFNSLTTDNTIYGQNLTTNQPNLISPPDSSNQNQLDYLMNENRRLLTVIDQYKNWVENYCSYYQQNQSAHQLQNAESTTQSIQTNDVSSINNPSVGSTLNVEKGDTNHSNEENERLKRELTSLKTEQEELLILMADQDLKLQQYAQRLRDFDSNDRSVTSSTAAEIDSSTPKTTASSLVYEMNQQYLLSQFNPTETR